MRIALLSESILLLRLYAPEIAQGHADKDGTNNPSFFAFYDVRDGRVIGLHHNSDIDLLHMYNAYYLDFRHPHSQHPFFAWRAASNKRLLERVKNSDDNTRQTSIRRALNQIPPPCQALSPSPYVDTSFFDFDSSVISATDRVKTVVVDSVRFYARDTMRPAFDLSISRPGDDPQMRKYVHWIFHPFDPLIISNVREGTPQNPHNPARYVNLHTNRA